MSSAMEEHDVGWPEPAAEVDSMEWIRSLVAMSLSWAVSSALMGILADFLVFPEKLKKGKISSPFLENWFLIFVLFKMPNCTLSSVMVPFLAGTNLSTSVCPDWETHKGEKLEKPTWH